MRKSLGDKRKQISDQQIAHITRSYVDAVSVAADADHADHAQGQDLRQRGTSATAASPSSARSLRFEMNTEETLSILKASRPLVTWEGRDALVEALQESIGSVWWTKAAGRRPSCWTPCPLTAMLKAFWNAVAVADPEGEVQRASARRCQPLTCATTRTSRSKTSGAYFAREVLPYVPDAWIDHDKTKVGYEIPFTRHFYVYTPPRPLEEIDAELRNLEAQSRNY